MTLQNLFKLLMTLVVVSILAVSCSEMTEQPTQSSVTDSPNQSTDPPADQLTNPGFDSTTAGADLEFELSAFDTSNIIWVIDTLKDIRQAPLAATSSWSVINDRIYIRACRDLGKDVGKQCKLWANDVVKYVTGYNLPTTQDNDFYLNYSSHCTRIVDGNVIGGGTIERGLSHGNIIQMRLNTVKYKGPHTAIFVAYTGSGMLWIDSNWYTKQYPNYVFIHYVPFTWFRSYVGTKYSVYQAWD